MFGFLKKKLKETVEKFSKKASEDAEIIEAPPKESSELEEPIQDSKITETTETNKKNSEEKKSKDKKSNSDNTINKTPIDESSEEQNSKEKTSSKKIPKEKTSSKTTPKEKTSSENTSEKIINPLDKKTHQIESTETNKKNSEEKKSKDEKEQTKKEDAKKEEDKKKDTKETTETKKEKQEDITKEESKTDKENKDSENKNSENKDIDQEKNKKGFFKKIFSRKETTDEPIETNKKEKTSSKTTPKEKTSSENTSEKIEENTEENTEEKIIDAPEKLFEENLKQTIEEESEEEKTEKKTKEIIHEDLLNEEVTDATKKKKSIFSKVKEKFVRFKLTEEAFEELFWDFELALLENNVAMEVIEKIKTDLHEQLTKENLTRKSVEEVLLDSLKKSLEEILDIESFDMIKKIKSKKPFVISIVGVNGSGKTTTIGKLIRLFQKNNLSVVVAAADTFRAAAIHQLQEHTDKLGVKLIKHDYNSDPAAVAFDAIKHATAKEIDVVLIDTAGRLQSNSNLMDELRKLIRVNKPDMNLFIGESITGNDCVEQAVAFNDAVGIDAIILSKADIDEKGGTALSISYVTKKPILYLGTGQTYDDLKPFDKEDILNSLGLI